MSEGAKGRNYDEFIKNYISTDKNGLSGLELREKKIQNYDFKKPKKYTKDQLKFIVNIYEIFSRHLASYLSTTTRSFSQVTLETVEEQSFVEYTRSLEENVLTAAMHLKPIEGVITTEVSNDLTFSLIDRLLGGTGNSKTLDRECTDIEVAVMGSLFKKMTEMTEAVWSNQIEVEAIFGNIETNSRYTQSITDTDTVLVITLLIDVNENLGKIRICLPCTNLDTIIEQASKANVKKKVDSKEEAKSKDAVIGHIKETHFVVKGILSEKEVTLKDVMNLQVGDVIRLDTRVDDKAILKVDDKVLFYGLQGLKNNKKAFRISEVL